MKPMKTYTDKTSNDTYRGGADPLHPLPVLFRRAIDRFLSELAGEGVK